MHLIKFIILPLKWGRLGNHNTLFGPKGVRIRAQGDHIERISAVYCIPFYADDLLFGFSCCLECNVSLHNCYHTQMLCRSCLFIMDVYNYWTGLVHWHFFGLKISFKFVFSKQPLHFPVWLHFIISEMQPSSSTDLEHVTGKMMDWFQSCTECQRSTDIV